MPKTSLKKTDEITSTIQQQTLKRFLWLKGNFTYCLLISALIWVVAICYYIEHFIGWNSILALSPTDFSSFVLAVTVPLFLLWFVLAYIERSSSLDANTQLFQMYINSLMYPDEDASQNAKALAAAMREQVKTLQTESRAVLSQSGQVKADLELRINELSNLLKTLDNYSAQTLTALNDNVKDLANRCQYITDKTQNSANQLKDCTADITHNSDRFLSKLTPIVDEIASLSSNIKSNIADNKGYLSTIKSQLVTCADLTQNYVKDMLLKTDENTRKVERSFYKTAEEYDALYKKLDRSISAIEGRVEEQKRVIHNQTQVINHNSDILNNQLAKYGKTVSEELDKLVKNSIDLEKLTKKQISTLKAVNHETGVAIQGIGDTFDEKRLEIERRSESAVNSMQNVVVALNKETDKLVAFTNLTQAKNHDLQNIAETIVDKIGDISSKLVLKTDTLKDKAVEVIDKFTEASELINRGTDKINNSSSLMVSNSEQSVKLLEEQNFYITNTLSNMDTLKEKLGKLHSEITKATTGLSQSLNQYEAQIDTNERFKSLEKIDLPKQEFDKEKLISAVKIINRVLRNAGANPEKLFDKQDMFDLWANYLDGQKSAFVDILAQTLTHKQTLAIRKAFDDNADFHNQVIRYLFLMDNVIKDILSNTGVNRDELINLSVNQSLDKIYFILVKALNSSD